MKFVPINHSQIVLKILCVCFANSRMRHSIKIFLGRYLSSDGSKSSFCCCTTFFRTFKQNKQMKFSIEGKTTCKVSLGSLGNRDQQKHTKFHCSLVCFFFFYYLVFVLCAVVVVFSAVDLLSMWVK